MGHKEDLLEGAKKCLVEIGYAQTTARDIVKMSGTNLASIGYHFGSKDALMFHAMIAMVGEWAEKIDAGAPLPPSATSAERFRARWERLISLFVEDRNVLVASFEAVGQIERQRGGAEVGDVGPGLGGRRDAAQIHAAADDARPAYLCASTNREHRDGDRAHHEPPPKSRSRQNQYTT